VATIEDLFRAHVDAFNARDLDALLAGFADDARWVTGRHGASGRGELTELFDGAMKGLLPTLVVEDLITETDRAAAQMVEHYTHDGVQHVDHIAGFFVFRDGLIVSAKIYREGSADLPD
jgi:hypothetical protein